MSSVNGAARASSWPLLRLLLALTAGLLGPACSSSGAPADGGLDAVDLAPPPDLLPPPPPIPFRCDNPGVPIKAGLNSGWKAAGRMREFHAALPKSTGRPLGVIFQWHGVGDTAANFQGFLQRGGVGPDSDPDFPFILITPESLQIYPWSMPQGMEWDLFDGTRGLQNLDLAFFEGLLGCLHAAYKIDSRRIYTVGFSAGAIMSNLLHSTYPQLIGAAYAASGAWFNDPRQAGSVSSGPLPKPALAWKALSPADRGTLLVSHGGPTDTYSALGVRIISFEECAGFALPFLKAHQRTVLDCPHQGGHRPHAAIGPAMVIDFLKAHPAGLPSPYAGAGVPPAFAKICTLQSP